jgi:hypothetical protein
MMKERHKGWFVCLGVVFFAALLVTAAPSLWADGAAVVRITTPTHDSTYVAGDPIQFSGSFRPGRDGSQEGVSMVWTSQLDGQIGVGMLLTTASLSVGNHRITLTVSGKEDSVLGSDTIRIKVDHTAAGAGDLSGVGGVEADKGADYFISPF